MGVGDQTAELLRCHLLATVPLRIAELVNSDGPTEGDHGRARAFGQRLAEEGDALLFVSHPPGKAAKLVAELTEAVAILAFCPGGVDLVGVHFEGKIIEKDRDAEKAELPL